VAAKHPQEDEARIAQGFKIAPVPLNLDGKNKGMVGLGSYLVNASGGCANCHSCPTFAPGQSKGHAEINAQTYLAGGVPFQGAVTSANLTPNALGLPGGLSLEQFKGILHRASNDGSEGLVVMPWSIYANLTPSDIEAMYEYLRAVPRAQPGECSGPGQ